MFRYKMTQEQKFRKWYVFLCFFPFAKR